MDKKQIKFYGNNLLFIGWKALYSNSHIKVVIWDKEININKTSFIILKSTHYLSINGKHSTQILLNNSFIK